MVNLSIEVVLVLAGWVVSLCMGFVVIPALAGRRSVARLEKWIMSPASDPFVARIVEKVESAIVKRLETLPERVLKVLQGQAGSAIRGIRALGAGVKEEIAADVMASLPPGEQIRVSILQELDALELSDEFVADHPYAQRGLAVIKNIVKERVLAANPAVSPVEMPNTIYQPGIRKG